MTVRACLLLAASGLLVGPTLWTAPGLADDPDVKEGVRLVETGDYDAAILTLDNAARRLASDPARVKDLSQAYVYLGIAYLGKGHEAAAQAKFREAVMKVKDLTLSPDEFPPKVIDLFEAARAEAMKAAPATATAGVAVKPTPTPAPKKKGSKTVLVLAGVGGAAVAGVAVASGGGGGDSGGSSTPVTPTPAPVRVEDLSGFLPAAEGSRRFPIRVLAGGGLLAELSWTVPEGRPLELVMQLFDAAGRDVAISNRTSPVAAVLRADVGPQNYELSVFYANECPGCETQFHLLVTHP